MLFATAVHGRLLRNHAQAAFAALSACAESYLYTSTKILGTLGWISVGAGAYFGGYYKVFGQGIASILAALISCVFKNDMAA